MHLLEEAHFCRRVCVCACADAVSYTFRRTDSISMSGWRRLRPTARWLFCTMLSVAGCYVAYLTVQFSQFNVGPNRFDSVGAPTVYDIVGLVRLVPR